MLNPFALLAGGCFLVQSGAHSVNRLGINKLESCLRIPYKVSSVSLLSSGGLWIRETDCNTTISVRSHIKNMLSLMAVRLLIASVWRSSRCKCARHRSSVGAQVAFGRRSIEIQRNCGDDARGDADLAEEKGRLLLRYWCFYPTTFYSVLIRFSLSLGARKKRRS